MISFPILQRNNLNQYLPSIEQQDSIKISPVLLSNSIQKINKNENGQQISHQTTKRIRFQKMSKLKILIPISKSKSSKNFQSEKYKTSESPLTDCSLKQTKSFNSDTHENQKKQIWEINLKQVSMQANLQTKSPFFLEDVRISFNQKYELLQKIGQGAHSSVYKCRLISTNQMFAVKITRNVDQEIKNRMIKQYKLLRVLDHPNVLKVEQLIFNQDQEKMYTISQLCQFKDLRHQMMRKVEAGQAFSVELIKQLLKKILETIQYLHDSGICHRDLKPQNILFNPQTNEIKLIDFQICSQKLIKGQNFVMWTNTGTLHYKAPQMFSLGYSQKIDIWSLGIILYELITGQIPFNSLYEGQTIKKIKYQQLNLLKLTKKCSGKIKFLLKKMLQKEAEQRFSCQKCLNFLLNQPKTFQMQDNFFSHQKTLQNPKKWYDGQDIFTVYPGYRIKMNFINWKISTESSTWK